MYNNNKGINDTAEFEKLMEQIFLELEFNDPRNTKILEAVSRDVLSRKHVTAGKSKSGIKKIIGRVNLNTVLIFSALASITVVLAYFINTNTTNDDKILPGKQFADAIKMKIE